MLAALQRDALAVREAPLINPRLTDCSKSISVIAALTRARRRSYPALSEVLPAIKRAGLLLDAIEILRLHYAEALRAWRDRFLVPAALNTLFGLSGGTQDQPNDYAQGVTSGRPAWRTPG
jgi:hypothetical protein